MVPSAMRLRQPFAHQRGQCRLHDGDAETGRDRGGVERRRCRPRRRARRRRTPRSPCRGRPRGVVPIRAISSDPGTAATAKIASGRPISRPTCVSDMCSSLWMSGITGGMARIVIRIATPASQSRHSGLSRRPTGGPAAEFRQEAWTEGLWEGSVDQPKLHQQTSRRKKRRHTVDDMPALLASLSEQR